MKAFLATQVNQHGVTDSAHYSRIALLQAGYRVSPFQVGEPDRFWRVFPTMAFYDIDLLVVIDVPMAGLAEVEREAVFQRLGALCASGVRTTIISHYAETVAMAADLRAQGCEVGLTRMPFCFWTWQPANCLIVPLTGTEQTWLVGVLARATEHTRLMFPVTDLLQVVLDGRPVGEAQIEGGTLSLRAIRVK